MYMLPAELQEIVKQYCIVSYEELCEYIMQKPNLALSVPEWRNAVEENRLSAPHLKYKGSRGVYHNGEFRITNDIVYSMIKKGITRDISKFIQHVDGNENYVLLAMRFNRKNALRAVLSALAPYRRSHERYLAYRYSMFQRDRRNRCLRVLASSVI